MLQVTLVQEPRPVLAHTVFVCPQALRPGCPACPRLPHGQAALSRTRVSELCPSPQSFSKHPSHQFSSTKVYWAPTMGKAQIQELWLQSQGEASPQGLTVCGTDTCTGKKIKGRER